MGPLAHSPADIIRRALIDLGQGADPDIAPLGAWPIYAAGEPGTPDNVCTVYDTQGTNDGRTMPDGETQEHHGIQVRVRAIDHKTGYAQARQIAVVMDSYIFGQQVQIGTNFYCVLAVTRQSDVVALGKEIPSSKRSLFTINATTHIRMIH